MESLNDESAEASEECEDTKLEYEGSSQDEDVDIYEDLDVNEEINGLEKNNMFSASPKELCERLLSPSKSAKVKGKLSKSPMKQVISDDDDDVDLYEDLDTFQNQITSEELQEKVDSLTRKCSSLDKENLELKAELERVQKQNHAFKVNISSLYKTAKVELGRKDRRLNELQRQHDTLLFRRGNSKNRLSANNNNTEQSADMQVTKETALVSKTVSIENNTAREFKIGNNSISFVAESHPFQENRFRRFESLAANILRDEQQLEKANPKKQNHPKKENHPKEAQTVAAAAAAAAVAASDEEGEIIDEKGSSSSRNSIRPENSKETSIERKGRPSYSRSTNERRRSRSPIGKRKRSPSIERRYLRSHPSSRVNERPSTLRNAPLSPQKRDERYKPSSGARSRRPNRR